MVFIGIILGIIGVFGIILGLQWFRGGLIVFGGQFVLAGFIACIIALLMIIFG